jgi:protease I
MKSLLIFVHKGYEDLELWYPKLRMEEAGWKTTIAGPEAQKTYEGKHGYPCKADISFKEARAQDFSALLIPGGSAPDAMRWDPTVLQLTKQFFDEKKMIAMICHGGQVAISAKILKGKKVTSYIAIKDDLENAGALWLDEPVVVDGNLISSRTPRDLPLFGKAMVELCK